MKSHCIWCSTRRICGRHSGRSKVGRGQGLRMKLAGDDPEHVIVVPGGLLTPTAKAGLTAAIGGDEIDGNLAEKGRVHASNRCGSRVYPRVHASEIKG